MYKKGEKMNKKIFIFRLLSKATFSNTVLLLIFFAFLFLRFYQLESRSEFRWDQVDNAWAAKDILIEAKLPLVGMVAKQNTGFFIGPLYYYFIAPFYWLFNMDPIASAVISRVTSTITFLVLYIVAKKIFSNKIALWVVALYTFSYYFLYEEGKQWPINFIAPVSLLIFYYLYKLLAEKKEKYVFLLTIFTGISFHLNFTAIFFPIIIFCCIPFFPRTKKMLFYSLTSFLLFIMFFVPNIIFELQHKASSTSHMLSYVSGYYHGFHLRRFIQIAPLSFIQYTLMLSVTKVDWLGYVVLPVFISILWFSKNIKKKTILIYLVLLWTFIPWIVFSVYKGEITDYYFALSVPVMLIAFSFIIESLLAHKNLIFKSVILLILCYYFFINLSSFFSFRLQGIDYHKQQARKAIAEGKIINYTIGDPQSYIYYIYFEKKNKK